jgi:hypothetical protein
MTVPPSSTHLNRARPLRQHLDVNTAISPQPGETFWIGALLGAHLARCSAKKFQSGGLKRGWEDSNLQPNDYQPPAPSIEHSGAVSSTVISPDTRRRRSFPNAVPKFRAAKLLTKDEADRGEYRQAAGVSRPLTVLSRLWGLAPNFADYRVAQVFYSAGPAVRVSKGRL